MSLSRRNFRFFLPGILLLAAGCETPLSEVRAVQLLSAPMPDARREAVAAMTTLYPADGKAPVYVSRYRELAVKDPDPTVRAMAVRALNICRDKSSTAVFITGLNDEDEWVRLESAKALVNVPDAGAVQALIERVRGTHPIVDRGETVQAAESRDVRIAAADALKNFKQLEVEHVLADALNAPEFGIAWQARQSLVAMTGQDLRYDEGAWLQMLTRPG